MKKSFWGSALVLALAGFTNTCVHNSKPVEVENPEIPAETVTGPNMELIREPLPPAVQSLLRKCQVALDHKQYHEAEAHAERAYRMEGRDYRVLFMQARVSLSLGSPQVAEQWAQKALESLGSRYKAHQVQTLQFIAKTRALQGDKAGELRAMEQSRSIR